MAKHKLPIYWGFLDENNQLTVCLYKDDKQIELTENMPFVKGIFDPFHCLNKADAYRKILEFIRKQQ